MNALQLTNNLYPALAREINEAHRAVQKHAKGMLFEAREAGLALLRAKKRVPHGQFKAWVETNTRVPYRTAARYMQVAKSVVDDTFDPDATIDSILDTNASRRNKAAPSFTRDDAEYALKIHALAERGVEGEQAVARTKLEGFAKQQGMTAEELVERANELCPHAGLAPLETEKAQLRTEILAPFQAMSKGELLNVIFDLLLKLSKAV